MDHTVPFVGAGTSTVVSARSFFVVRECVGWRKSPKSATTVRTCISGPVGGRVVIAPHGNPRRLAARVHRHAGGTAVYLAGVTAGVVPGTMRCRRPERKRLYPPSVGGYHYDAPTKRHAYPGGGAIFSTASSTAAVWYVCSYIMFFLRHTAVEKLLFAAVKLFVWERGSRWIWRSKGAPSCHLQKSVVQV